MKQIYLKPLAFRLTAVLLIITTALAIHSCKKDKQEKNSANAVIDPVVSNAKQWYDSVYKKVSNTNLTTQSIGRLSRDWSKKFLPKWDKANTFTKDGITYIELPAIKIGDMAILSKLADTVNFDFSKSGTLTSLVIVKGQKNYNMYAMTILADTSYLKGDYSKLANNTYQKMDKDFTGSVFFNQMDGTFVNGWHYKNGTIVRWLSPYTPTGNQTIQSIDDNKLKINEDALPCGASETSTLWEDCSYYENSPNVLFNCFTYTVTSVSYSCGYLSVSGPSGGTTAAPPPCVIPPPTVAQDAIRSKGLVINVSMPPPGGGSTTPTPLPCAATLGTETITDNVTNPCLKALLDKLTIDNTIQTDVTNVLRNTFGVNDQINLTFIDGDFTHDPNVGQGSAGTDRLSFNNFDVKFNTPIIANASKEYLLETAMHEIYHAYLYANPSVKNGLTQHTYMIQNYVNTEVITLQNVFPNLSLHDAQCLVLGGYGDIDQATLNVAIAAYGLPSSDVVTTNNNFKAGVSGTRC